MKVKSYKSGSVGQVEFDEKPFGEKVLYRTLKDAVVMFQANQRQGTVKTKTRGEVKGTNKKPYRQKHTGRARAGDVKSPIWRGGGTVFGPRPRDYSYAMPKRAKIEALRSALLSKFRDGEIVLVDSFGLDKPKTKTLAKLLASCGWEKGGLIVANEPSDALLLSARNLRRVEVVPASDVNAYQLLLHRNVVMTEDALATVKGRTNNES